MPMVAIEKQQDIDSKNIASKRDNLKVWLAACVQIYHEKKTSSLLTNLGIENYLPIQVEHHKWSDRVKRIERLVLPMIIFVRVDNEQRKSVLQLSSIYKYISNPAVHSPAVIPDLEMERFRFMLDSAENSVEFFQQPIKEGTRVRVVKGPLHGLDGLLVNVSSKSKVAVKLDVLGYACVDMPVSYVESLE